MYNSNIILMLLAAATATYIWRASGTYVGSTIAPSGKASKWINCVAYGMLAGLISRILIFPVGFLADTLATERLFALAMGIAAYFLLNSNIFFGTIVAGISFYIILV